MRTPALIVCCIVSINFCFAQTHSKPRNNALSVEIGKTGIIYNLGYDLLFRPSGIGVRAIAGTTFGKYFRVSVAGAGGYYLIGNRGRRDFFESGLDAQYVVADEVSDDQRGFVFVYPDYPTNTYYFSLNTGYRHYGKASLFRIGLAMGRMEHEFIPGGYISYGVTF